MNATYAIKISTEILFSSDVTNTMNRPVGTDAEFFTKTRLVT